MFGNRSARHRGFSMGKVFDSMQGRYDAHVLNYIQNVYAVVAMALISFTLGCSLAILGYLSTMTTLAPIVSLVGLLYIMFSSPENQRVKIPVLLGTALSMGLGAWPLFLYPMAVNPSIVVSAALGTAVVFVSFSLAALLGKRGSYLFLGQILFQIVLICSVAMLSQALIGFPGRFVFSFYPYLMLVVALGFVLYDTQIIVERVGMGGRKDLAVDACVLFMDAVEIFKQLLVILSERDRAEKKRRN